MVKPWHSKVLNTSIVDIAIGTSTEGYSLTLVYASYIAKANEYLSFLVKALRN